MTSLSHLTVIIVVLLLVSVHMSVGAIPLDDDNIHGAVTDHLNGGTTYGPIQDWNTSGVTNMSTLFFCVGMLGAPLKTSCYNFNGNISGWDVSQVTNMVYMFFTADSFNQDINDWDVSQVTDMYRMFSIAESFNQPVNDWDVSQVTDMGGMFIYADSFNQDLNDWDVSSVWNMRFMFEGASSLDQVLCWNPSTDGPPDGHYFDYYSGDTSDYDWFEDMFHNSPGSLAPYPECLGTTPTSNPTPPPSLSPSPIWIYSGISYENKNWCLAPVKGAYAGASLGIRDCTIHKFRFYQWVMDGEGKIRNYWNQSLCIEGKGININLSSCRDGSIDQRWIYSSNRGRILNGKNARQEVTVVHWDYMRLARIELLTSEIAPPMAFHEWVLQYVWPVEVVSLPSYDKFIITSQLSTAAQKWCLLPKRNTFTPKTVMTLSTYSNWKAWRGNFRC